VKELFPEVTLGLGCLEERVKGSIGEPWLRKVSIVCWHDQLLEVTELLSDEFAQSRGWVGAFGQVTSGATGQTLPNSASGRGLRRRRTFGVDGLDQQGI
jgi:hypothetical protein